jgi:hypothetical protein
LWGGDILNQEKSVELIRESGYQYNALWEDPHFTEFRDYWKADKVDSSK